MLLSPRDTVNEICAGDAQSACGALQQREDAWGILPPPQAASFIASEPHQADLFSTEREVLLQHLQGLAAQTGTDTGLNVVAYTGSVKDAIVASILESSFEERTVLCMVADGMSRQQQLHAELTADLLGIELWQVSAESDSQGPVEAVAAAIDAASDCVLFCGASASDLHAGLSVGGVKTLLQDLNDGVIDQLTKALGLQQLCSSLRRNLASPGAGIFAAQTGPSMPQLAVV